MVIPHHEKIPGKYDKTRVFVTSVCFFFIYYNITWSPTGYK